MKAVFSSDVFRKALKSSMNENSNVQFTIVGSMIVINGKEIVMGELSSGLSLPEYNYSSFAMNLLIDVLSRIPEQPVSITFHESYLELSNVTFS